MPSPGSNYPRRTDVLDSHRALREKRRKDDIAVVSEGGAVGSLDWTFVPLEDYATDVGVVYEPDLTDSANIAYAYDDNFLYFRGGVSPNGVNADGSSWANNSLLFSVPLPAGAPLTSPFGGVMDNRRYAAIYAATLALGFVPGWIFADYNSGSHLIEIFGGVPGTVTSLDISNGVGMILDGVQHPLG
jgi:hypothetical protein